jgi:hypothetical protein
MANRRCGWNGRAVNIVVLSTAMLAPIGQPLAQEVDDLDQLGIRTERWNIFPSLGFSTVYDDNVFAVPKDNALLEDDVSFILAPEVTFEANTQRHAFSLGAGAEIERYLDQTVLNRNDFFVDTAGRWDVSRTFDVAASFGFSRRQEDQTDPDRALIGVAARETTQVNRFAGGLAVSKNWQRTFARASADVRRTTFEALDLTLDDETVDLNADRDRFRIPFNFRLGYEVDRDYDLFVNLGYTLVRYDEPEQILTATGVEEGPSQDFDTLSLLVGTDVDFDRLVTGEFAVGVERRFEDSELEDDEFGFSFAADLDWTLSPRTELAFRGSQGFEPATADGAGGSALVTRVALDLSYALSRQISLGGNFGYIRDDRGEDARTDNDFRGGVSASYAINRFASVSANYEYRQRNSTDAFREFERNLVFLTLTGRY